MLKAPRDTPNFSPSARDPLTGQSAPNGLYFIHVASPGNSLARFLVFCKE